MSTQMAYAIELNADGTIGKKSAYQLRENMGHHHRCQELRETWMYAHSDIPGTQHRVKSTQDFNVNSADTNQQISAWYKHGNYATNVDAEYAPSLPLLHETSSTNRFLSLSLFYNLLVPWRSPIW